MEFAGWAALKAPRVEQRWLDVKDCTVPAVPGLCSPAQVHSYCREYLEYRRESVDVWSSPGQTFARGYGDCEDWAIAERALLIAGGFPSDRLWLILARDLVVRQDHAFLIAGAVALDCRAAAPIPVARLSDYRPIFGYCDDAQYLFGRKRT